MYMRSGLDAEPNYSNVSKSLLCKAGIGSRYWEVDLSGDLCKDATYAKRCREYVRNMAHSEKEGMGLLLHGPHGSGKTGAACRMLIEVIARSVAQVFFMSAEDIDWYSRNRGETTPEGARVWDLLTRDAQFVVVDDLGAEENAAWKAPAVEHVLSSRYNWKLPTYVTTNMEPAELFKRCPRLGHLAQDTYITIKVEGVSWRA